LAIVTYPDDFTDEHQIITDLNYYIEGELINSELFSYEGYYMSDMVDITFDLNDADFVPGEEVSIKASMKNIEVEGANGGLHTNYEGKAMAAVDALTKEGYDFVYIHVEAPDEMGHQGSVENKIKAIENLDEKVIKVVKQELDKAGVAYRMLITPDHPTPIRCRTHTSAPIPYMIYDSTDIKNSDLLYNEKDAKKSGNELEEGYKLMDMLLK
jgi:2,3-bisphosphoglycerate-independent phosphoglycerate mutase